MTSYQARRELYNRLIAEVMQPGAAWESGNANLEPDRSPRRAGVPPVMYILSAADRRAVYIERRLRLEIETDPFGRPVVTGVRSRVAPSRPRR